MIDENIEDEPLFDYYAEIVNNGCGIHSNDIGKKVIVLKSKPNIANTYISNEGIDYYDCYIKRIKGETYTTLGLNTTTKFKYNRCKSTMLKRIEIDKNILPSNWLIIAKNKEDFDIILKWSVEIMGKKSYSSYEYYYNMQYGFNNKGEYTNSGERILFEDFKKYILKDNISTIIPKEIIPFHIKYSPEFTEDLFDKLTEWCKKNIEGRERGFVNHTFENFKNRANYFVVFDFNTYNFNYGLDNNPQGCKSISISDLKALIGYNDIKPETMEKTELGSLPEKWCILRTKDNYEVINDYINSIIGKKDNAYANYNYIGLASNKLSYNSNSKIEGSLEGYTEITFDQFKKWVLKEEEVKYTYNQLPDKWKVRFGSKEQFNILNSHFKNKKFDHHGPEYNDSFFLNDGGYLSYLDYKSKKLDYTEISFDDFKKLVLNDKTMRESKTGYHLNETVYYLGIKGKITGFDGLYLRIKFEDRLPLTSYSTHNGVDYRYDYNEYGENIPKVIDNFNLSRFILSTDKELSKLPPVNVKKTECIKFSDEFKKGDKVIVTDFGSLNHSNSFSINTPYILFRDFNSRNGFIIEVDNNGYSNNGWDGETGYKNIKLKRYEEIPMGKGFYSQVVNIDIDKDTSKTKEKLSYIYGIDPYEGIKTSKDVDFINNLYSKKSNLQSPRIINNKQKQKQIKK